MGITKERLSKENINSDVLVLIDGREECVAYSDFLETFQVAGMVRIPENEFVGINFDNGILSHFNLEKTDRKVGERYIFVKILRHGRYGVDTELEQPPLISLDGARVAECVYVRNSIPYDELSAGDFRRSVGDITDPGSLHDHIKKWYSETAGELSPESILEKGVAMTLFRPTESLDAERSRMVVSEEAGFVAFLTESVSSKSFVKEGMIYKLTQRDSAERQHSDLATLEVRMRPYRDHIPDSRITECEYKGEIYTCVVQPLIDGLELKKIPEDELRSVLKANKEFLLFLLDYFFEAITEKELYPDPIGYPDNPEYFNATNLMLEKASGKIILCDVGLTPHEDSLNKYGLDFYNSENVTTYIDRMTKFKAYLLALQ